MFPVDRTHRRGGGASASRSEGRPRGRAPHPQRGWRGPRAIRGRTARPRNWRRHRLHLQASYGTAAIGRTSRTGRLRVLGPVQPAVSASVRIAVSAVAQGPREGAFGLMFATPRRGEGRTFVTLGSPPNGTYRWRRAGPASWATRCRPPPPQRSRRVRRAQYPGGGAARQEHRVYATGARSPSAS